MPAKVGFDAFLRRASLHSFSFGHYGPAVPVSEILEQLCQQSQQNRYEVIRYTCVTPRPTRYCQYMAVAEAFSCGMERHLDADLNPNVASVASLFVSRRDAVMNKVPESLGDQLGIVIDKRTYKA